jgi:outer membrane immunogenic protein
MPAPPVVPAGALNYWEAAYFTAEEKRENEKTCFGTSAGLDRRRGLRGRPACCTKPGLHKGAGGGQPRRQLDRLLHRRRGGYASENTSDPLGIKGGFAGGTVGYNWQFGTIVAGLEADGAWADVSNSTTIAGITVAAKVDALATLRGRVGVAFDQVLFYGTGGLALADTTVSASALGVTFSDSKTLTGWTVGAGAEWMFMPHWSLKAEYLYRSFGGQTFFATQFPPGIATGTLNVNSGQVGVNFHF